jgi:hypothetical protein
MWQNHAAALFCLGMAGVLLESIRHAVGKQEPKEPSKWFSGFWFVLVGEC